MSDKGALGPLPWVVVSPQGVTWVGLADGEDGAWQIALGWPSQDEIAWRKGQGWYAAQGTLTWPSPHDGLRASPAAEKAKADAMHAADRAVLMAALRATQEGLDQLITATHAAAAGGAAVGKAMARARALLPEGFHNAYRGQADFLPPHQRRVYAEHLVLEARLEALRGFLASPQFEAADQKDLLLQQATHMERYALVLRQRLEAWGISPQPGPDGAPALREDRS